MKLRRLERTRGPNPDAQQFLDIHTQLMEGNTTYDLFQGKSMPYFLDGDDGEPVGTALLEPYSEHEITLDCLVIREELRNRGLGARGLELIESAVRKEGYKTIWLSPSARAASLYTRAGYTVRGKHSMAKDL